MNDKVYTVRVNLSGVNEVCFMLQSAIFQLYQGGTYVDESETGGLDEATGGTMTHKLARHIV